MAIKLEVKNVSKTFRSDNREVAALKDISFEVEAGSFLVIAHGTADEVAKARGILEAAGATEAETHGA